MRSRFPEGRERGPRGRHGMRGHRAYNTWNHMMSRCYSEKDRSYKWWGGVGVRVDVKWHRFSGFWEDMGEGYQDGLSLDRIDPTGNYCKENCRWVPLSAQRGNSRDKILVEMYGEGMSLQDACDKFGGVDYNLVWQRIKIYKWDVVRALTTPSRVKKKRNNIKHDREN